MTTNLQERYPDTLAEGESAILAETNGFIKRLCRTWSFGWEGRRGAVPSSFLASVARCSEKSLSKSDVVGKFVEQDPSSFCFTLMKILIER